MSEEHLPPLSSWGQLADPPKRKRTPSQYASQIADFKNNATLNSKRHRSIRFAEPEQPPQNNTRPGPPKQLRCTLPNGKTYNLTIVPPSRQPPSQKSQRRKLRRMESVTSNPIRQQKKQQSVCLLDKFLSAFQNLQKEEEVVDSKSNHEASKQDRLIRPPKREDRTRRQHSQEQRWTKWHQRYASLSERLERMQETYIFLI